MARVVLSFFFLGVLATLAFTHMLPEGGHDDGRSQAVRAGLCLGSGIGCGGAR